MNQLTLYCSVFHMMNKLNSETLIRRVGKTDTSFFFFVKWERDLSRAYWNWHM